MARKAKSPESKDEAVKVMTPVCEELAIPIRGERSGYMQNRWAAKSLSKMRGTQEEGTRAKSRKPREPKDFEECYLGATHIMEDGSYGIPVMAFKRAMVDSCRHTDLKMAATKTCFFIEPDGLDKTDGTPLVRITKGKPRMDVRPVRNSGPGSSCDLRARPYWDPGWEAIVRIRVNPRALSRTDIVNLLMCAGMFEGIGEGRPSSPKSCGMDMGFFGIIPSKKSDGRKEPKEEGVPAAISA